MVWAADERRSSGTPMRPSTPPLKYVVYGSVQQGGPGMLRVNMRISDGITTDYLWAGRNGFRLEDLASMQTEVIRQISRVLHLLLIQEAARCLPSARIWSLTSTNVSSAATLYSKERCAPNLASRHNNGSSPR